MKSVIEPTYSATIWIAGDLGEARRICRDFCRRGACVTVTPTEFIYTGGAEYGVMVRFIQYPRFPKDPPLIKAAALELAELLREGLCQHSFTVECVDDTIWGSVREA